MLHQKSWRKFTSFKQGDNWLVELSKNREDYYTTERIKLFLDKVGNPQKKYKVVHVAGTSGKGSTCHFISSILQAAGHKVGLTVSPYFMTPLERIQVNQKNIKAEFFIGLLNKYRELIKECNLTYFEAWIALGLIAFAEKKVDYAVIEVGMGGRYDGTNVFDDPALAIVTNIGLDHTEILGNTKAKIAKEKEQIIKNPKKALTGSKLIKKARYIDVKNYKLKYRLNLKGKFQKENAALAVEAARFLKIPEKYIKQGLLEAKNPGRFEILKKKPLVIRDGAHNPDKITALKESLKEYKRNKNYLLMAVKDTKDYKKMLKIITPEFDEIVFTSFKGSYDPKLLQKEVPEAKIIKNPKKAYQSLLKGLKNNDLLVVTGSLYLLGEIFDS